jgi:hypothetical protein
VTYRRAARSRSDRAVRAERAPYENAPDPRRSLGCSRGGGRIPAGCGMIRPPLPPCAKGDSNPTDASRELQLSRDPAVTTKACVGTKSRFVPPNPWPAHVVWQPRGSGIDVKMDFKLVGRSWVPASSQQLAGSDQIGSSSAASLTRLGPATAHAAPAAPPLAPPMASILRRNCLRRRLRPPRSFGRNPTRAHARPKSGQNPDERRAPEREPLVVNALHLSRVLGVRPHPVGVHPRSARSRGEWRRNGEGSEPRVDTRMSSPRHFWSTLRLAEACARNLPAEAPSRPRARRPSRLAYRDRERAADQAPGPPRPRPRPRRQSTREADRGGAAGPHVRPTGDREGAAHHARPTARERPPTPGCQRAAFGSRARPRPNARAPSGARTHEQMRAHRERAARPCAAGG